MYRYYNTCRENCIDGGGFGRVFNDETSQTFGYQVSVVFVKTRRCLGTLGNPWDSDRSNETTRLGSKQWGRPGISENLGDIEILKYPTPNAIHVRETYKNIVVY